MLYLRYVVSTVEPYYRVVDTERDNATVGSRKTIKGALRLAAKLNTSDSSRENEN